LISEVNDVALSSCPKCGGSLQVLGATGRGVCSTCGIIDLPSAPTQKEPVQSENRLRNMIVSRKIIVIALIVIIIGVGGVFYILQQPSEPSLTPTRTTIIQSPTTTMKPTEIPTHSPSPTSTTTATPIINEETKIKEMLNGYYDAFNKHHIEKYLDYFKDNGQKLYNHGEDGIYTGHESIEDQLKLILQVYPDITLKNIDITKLEISEETATIECKYLVSSEKRQYIEQVTEYIQLVKINDAWKIAQTDLVSES